jgi:hypothetical protein
MASSTLSGNRNLRVFAFGYAVASVLVLISGRGILLAGDVYLQIVLACLLGPLEFLAYIAVYPSGYWRPALMLYVPATLLLLTAVSFTQHSNRAGRLAASCVGAGIWIAAAYANALLRIYGH